jgi:hypothetical protein
MHTLSISPKWEQKLDLHHLSGETHLSSAAIQTMPRHRRRPLVHGEQEAKLQLDLGQRRQVTTSRALSTFPHRRLLLSRSLIRKTRTLTA